MNFYYKNIELLKNTQPTLADRLVRNKNEKNVHVVLSKDGNPIPQVGTISLHSNYYPIKEASESISKYKLKEQQRPVVYGLGFGYHVLEIIKKYNGSELLVIEPVMEIFQAFLENVDIEPFISKTKFIISIPVPKILATNKTDNWNIFEHPSSRRVSYDYFSDLDKAIETSNFLCVNSLKILVINPYYGGSLPTAKFCTRALNDMGHHAESVECDKFAEGFFSIKKITKSKFNEQVLSNQFDSFIGQLITAKAADFEPDLILSIAQAPLTPETIKSLRPLNVPIVFWFVEDFRTLSYWKDVSPHYDHFFTIQRGEFFEKLANSGATNYYYLPQACLPEVHKTIHLTPEDVNRYSSDVSFMGAGYYNRVQSFSRLLNHDFKIWGTEWDLGSTVGKRVQNNNKRIDPDQIVKIYNSGKININLHSSSFHNGVNPVGDFVNPRTFEISACGGFQLVDERSELSELMIPEVEITTFNSVDDLCQKVDFFLNHDDKAKIIATRGKERVLNEHTIQHRMHEMLIHVFTNNLNSLKERLNSMNRDPVRFYIEQVGNSSSLGKYLSQFVGSNDFSIKTMVDQIAKGEGDLSDEELLVLMTDQLVKPTS